MKRRACLILGAFMEFIMDCTDAGIDPRTLDLTGIMNEKIDELEDSAFKMIKHNLKWDYREYERDNEDG
jgi:hypothetical protein